MTDCQELACPISKAQHLARSMIESVHNLQYVRLAHGFEVSAFGKILTDQAIGVNMSERVHLFIEEEMEFLKDVGEEEIRRAQRRSGTSGSRPSGRLFYLRLFSTLSYIWCRPERKERVLPEDILQKNVPLAPYTTIGLGGNARYFATCESVDELREYLRWAAVIGLPVQVLGGGSNILFADAGFPGLVLHTGLRGVDFADEGDMVQVTAAAGEDWDAFVRTCVERGLSGIECLSGIPGQVGATPIQNVGAYGQEVAQTVHRVRALDRHSLELFEFFAEECRFAYRQSRFKAEDRDRYIVTEVVYRLRRNGSPELRYPELRRRIAEKLDLDALQSGAPALTAVRDAVLALRRAKSMVVDPDDPNSRSLGSFFLNPVLTEAEFAILRERVDDPDSIPTFPAPDRIKIPAAWLIEQAGFHKGYRRGRSAISEKHALALVNLNGTTRELLILAAEIQDGVFEKFGIHLEREPIVVE